MKEDFWEDEETQAKLKEYMGKYLEEKFGDSAALKEYFNENIFRI